MTLHHCAVLLPDNREAPQHIRNHQAYHQSRGWPDIAYHLIVDRNGNLYRGRPIWAVGDTGTNYDPTGHLLVLAEGNFEQQRPSWRQVNAIVDVMAWAGARYDVPLWKIRGHRDYAATACPGKHLYRHLETGSLRERVRDRLDAGGVRLVGLCGEAGQRAVEEIEAGTR
ncbi:MAG: N-acetylmuramoyl-L-alanine amidase [Actinobacteria bacterium]|nr:N-acetylmuramoyl-L-alanine amidase [Actinomycetota bacterium]